MKNLSLSEADLSVIQSLFDGLLRQYQSVADPDFLERICVYASELPASVRNFVNSFRFSEPSWGAMVIRGYPVDPARIGSTPEHWNSRALVSLTLAEEMLLVLLGTLLGDVFGWATEQGGCIVHEVIPIREHEYSQMSTGSEQVIWWHTEDAFHPYTSDHIGLVCLRNPERVPTTFACIDHVRLDPEVTRILFEPRFIINPVESHQQHNKKESMTETCDAQDVDVYKRIEQMNANPQKVAVLYGEPQSPYIRIDPYFMNTSETDEDARRALEVLIKALDECLSEQVLEPGDFCFIDNYKAVHGRKPFKARYDGNDRWLKRINITRDLRKSRAARASATSRIIL